MRKAAAVVCALLFVVLNKSLLADTAAIQPGALPQQTTVLAALDDARQLEPYARSWSATWKYDIPKDQVISRLSKDLGFLKLALKEHGDNLELLLLTGLVAHYAYNMDVPDSYDLTIASFKSAQELAPADVRAPWFRASMLCQTDTPKQGADEFLSIEQSHPWEQMPAAFWDDYLECASVTNMPAHVLRASDHLNTLLARPSSLRSFLVGTAQKRFDPFDAKKNYDPKVVWSGVEEGKDVVLTATSCGLRLRVREQWNLERLELANGSCVANFATGPYKATSRDLRPEILVLVKQPENGEDLAAFARRFTKKGTFEPLVISHCPSDKCISMKGVQSGMYGKDGDGHGRILAFEREQPKFPGLLFESPMEAPKSGGAAGVKYYRPDQTQQRIPGKLYYLVLLDTASSIELSAMRDWDFFLKNLVAE